MGGHIVAIVGRPNVGKSTLFNRLTATRTAIEERSPGVTRDRLYGSAEWQGESFIVVDTGGISFDSDDPLLRQVHRQVDLAIEEAQVIIFLLDGREGPVPLDHEIAGRLRRSGKSVIPVVNKVDHPKEMGALAAFYSLGMGDPLPISAVHGRGTGDLLDRICELLPQETAEGEPAEETIKVALVGRPNVGKSQLLNTILGRERVIVSDIPGTTRDAIDTPFSHGGRSYLLIDTAGVRRKSRVKEAVEYYSVLRSLRAIERADIALLLLDAAEGIAEQDRKLAGYIDQVGRGLIIGVNKWDLIQERQQARQEWLEEISRAFAFAPYAQVAFFSALTGSRVQNLFPLLEKVWQELYKRVPTSLLNELLIDALAVNPPPSYKGKRLKIYYASQVAVRPPTFVFFVNNPQFMHFSYQRYLENRLREAFDFAGVPLRLKIKGRRERGE
ncbi:MAG: ribosome biogenesis GTPase Der [Firmicutes bacterium]|mgnify:CR=1 FL=1|nr:ribosome biogenesis GTPase Der [Bacillota bacterium]HPU00332.1 ribosome biogenesis GTPase Der [Bacillota bacterium]